MTAFGARVEGAAYVVGDNIDTDQIIPARYLTFNPAIPEERKQFGRYALIGLPEASAGLPHGKTPFVQPGQERSRYRIVIAGRNFGCGSSREHAPLALAEAGVVAVVAEFYARIFYRNAVNGGYLMPLESSERLCEAIATGEQVALDLAALALRIVSSGRRFPLKPLGEVAAILQAGDLFAYARQRGILEARAGRSTGAGIGSEVDAHDD